MCERRGWDKDNVIIVMLAIIMFLHVLHVRSVQNALIRFIFWQWIKMGKASAMFYSWLHDMFNS